MDNKYIILLAVVIVGVAAGVGFVSKSSQDPLLKELLTQQQAILTNINSSSGPNVLEQRVAKIESQIEEIKTAVANAQAPQRPAGPPPEDLSKVHTIDAAHSPIRGNVDAPVRIVEFVDFECPFCARFHPPINEVMEAYPGKVSYMIKNFPLSFHPNAAPASRAAFAAGEQGKYFEMADLLLDNGRNLNEQTFERLATELNLDIVKFKRDYKESQAKWDDFIQKDIALGGAVDVRGTPTFYINGRKTNARNVETWKQEIDKILNQ